MMQKTTMPIPRRNFKTTGRWHKRWALNKAGINLKIPNPSLQECPVNIFVQLDQQEEIDQSSTPSR
jgi:hypothetical protein